MVFNVHLFGNAPSFLWLLQSCSCISVIKRFLYFLRFDIADIITSLTIVCKPLSESCLIACYIPGSRIRSEGMSSSFDTTSSTFSYENDEERQDNCYYSYDHASGRHVLMKQKHGAAFCEGATQIFIEVHMLQLGRYSDFCWVYCFFVLCNNVCIFFVG